MIRIIWDWNGTLFDDVDLSFQVVNRLLDLCGYSCLETKQDYRNVFQFPIYKYYQKAGFDLSIHDFSKLAQIYMADYQPKSFQCQLRSDALQALSLAEEYGFSQTILSASEKKNLKEQIDRFEIEKYMDSIYAIDNIEAAGKEQLAMQIKNEYPNDSLWIIGDSMHDAQVASAIDAQCILIKDGHENIEMKYKGIICDSLIESVKVIYERNCNSKK